MSRLKSIALLLTGVFQITAVVFLFINIWVSVLLFITYGIAMLLLFGALIMERIKEKEDDDENDYTDY
ncbi:hypothetical protein [Alkalihalobacillus sp. AL-G]|uniref:hypothetical protein n=1 Tax=Alkalihalobacillus sp. AL-G TaxID=2926399 RepID=UPI00272BDFAB|nr:hypothetical protein [Alkalihalobacillus sp. AL-G]WLD93932.1 hypothetical protein MOJ78_03160 [Alkalihalobacillus sp. AL-G]